MGLLGDDVIVPAGKCMDAVGPDCLDGGRFPERGSSTPVSDYPAVLRDIVSSERTGPRRRLAAIAFLDLVGYARLMGADDEATLHDWSLLRGGVIEPRVRRWHGRIAHCAGDGLFIEFPSALDAFRWAVSVQDAMAARPPAERSLEVRVALHLGDVIDDADGEVRGDGVNTAARLQSHARPGGVIISGAVADEVAGKTERALCSIGRLRLRHIARPVHAFHVSSGPVDARADPVRRGTGGRAQPGGAVWRRLGLAAAVLAMLLAVSARDGLLAGLIPPHGAAALSPRLQAERLTEAGRAIRCTEHPCPREWLASRLLYQRAVAADATYGPAYAEAALTYTIFIVNDLSLDEAADLQAAERLATSALALAPDAAITHRARGAVLGLQPDRLQDALAAYMRSLAIDPNQPAVRGSAGWTLILLGRPLEAELMLRAALAAAPDHLYAPAWLTYLGWAELFLDRPGHGADQFRRAIAQQSRRAANGDIALQRSLNLAAALALDGDLAGGRRLVAELRGRYPTLSTQAVWNCDCSRAPGYLAGVAMLRRGAELAGLPDTP